MELFVHHFRLVIASEIPGYMEIDEKQNQTIQVSSTWVIMFKYLHRTPWLSLLNL